MNPRTLLLGATLLLVVFGILPTVARAGDGKEASDPEPAVVVYVPIDEMDVLLDADRRGVVLRHDEYQRLLAEARAKTEESGRLPPVEGALASAEGVLDLRSPEGAALDVTYHVEVLATGTSIVPFAAAGLALDLVEVEGEGRYEELDGKGRLRFEGAGSRSVRVRAYATPSRSGEQRLLDVHLAPAAAMALTLELPPAVTGAAVGEGNAVRIIVPPGKGTTLEVRPARDGHLRVAWEPAQRTVDTPPLLDVETRTLHGIEDGLIRSRILVHVDVLGTPVETLDLEVPADLALRAVGGDGVTGSRRSEDRTHLHVDLEGKRHGRVTLTLDAETPARPEANVLLPRVIVPGAVRQRGRVALAIARDVEVHGVHVEGGRRLVSQKRKGQAPLLRYELASADGAVRVDLVPGDLRLEASSTYYLNLTEPEKTLLAAITYHVMQGTAFCLRPRFPAGYGLCALRINGTTGGFGFDARSDGTVEVRLDRGVREGAQIELLATLEQAAVDWVPEEGTVRVAFAVPSAGAAREEGFVGVGADASFGVLDADVKDMVCVGAAQLATRGVSPEGLVYGYRLDGPAPSVLLEVERRTARLDATVVALAWPGPRRLLVENVVIHVIERAGVRCLEVDVPTWARDVVRIDAPDLVASSRLEDAPEDVPDGYDRWEVVLARRVLGRHVLSVRYWEDQDENDWTVPADRALAVRVPLERVERSVVVGRAPGLEVGLLGPAPTEDLSDLPPEVTVEALAVREIVHLGAEMDGPGIAVRKHDGAPVLDAIAPLVSLETGVAREGILRTRAEVRLVNVGLQFLKVALPAGSRLIGAVVDQESVKPLSDAHGVLAIPIPPARRRGARTVAVLTYETQLGEEALGEVVIPAPDFPGLEVLRTTYTVAFDPDFEVEQVRGDYGGTGSIRGAVRSPWLVELFRTAAMPAVRSTSEGEAQVRDKAPEEARLEAGLVNEAAKAAAVRTFSETMTELDFDSLRQQVENLERLGETLQRRHAGFVELEEVREDVEDREFGEPLTNFTPPSLTSPPQMPGEPPPQHDAPSSGNVPADPADPAGPASGPRGPARVPLAGGEGPGPVPITPPAPPRLPRRKGLLSLDVPVLLSPNVVHAERLGSGGSMTVAVVARDAVTAAYWFWGLVVFAAGLALATRGHGSAVAVPVAGFTLALLVWLVFGETAGVVPAAIADATTALVGVLLLRWGVRHLVVTRSKAVAATSVVLAAFLLAGATARADEEPASELEVPSTVYVPYDPGDPEVPRADDRVFLPLETYLELRRRAHPEEDPDVLAKGRVVTILGAKHRLRVGKEEAEGVLTFRLAKRGKGLSLVPLCLGGLAVSRARLDGEPIPLLLEEGVYHLPLDVPGDHDLVLDFKAPVSRDASGRRLAIDIPPFAGAQFDLEIEDFEGLVRVEGAGRVVPVSEGTPAGTQSARAYIGNLSHVVLVLDDPRGTDPEVPLRTRTESHVVHSIRDGGTQTVARITLYVLQGKAVHVDIALPEGVIVLRAGGGAVARWETGAGRLRLVFAEPMEGEVPLEIVLARAADAPAREETLPALEVAHTTGERGLIVVNADPFLRVEAIVTEGLLRTATPRDEISRGSDKAGRVAGAWHFAARPTRFVVRVEEAAEGLAITTQSAVVFGDDHVVSRFDAVIEVDPRVPIGDLVFDLPGTDEIRSVTSAGLATWWTQGEDEERRLHLRYADLRHGTLAVRVHLERRLGGQRDAVTVPYWRLRGAARDRGRLVLYALPDVDPDPGRLPGLRSLPLGEDALPTPPSADAVACRAFRWEETPGDASLPVTLRTPSLEAEAVVVTSIHPGVESHRLEHLVLFDVTLGSADRFDLFVPDGGMERLDVVRTRDLREVRKRRVVRRGPDGGEVEGMLYEIRVQARRGGISEVTVSQVVAPDRPIRVVRPERVMGEGNSERDLRAARWFTLVRSFLDGEVDVRAVGAAPDPVEWEDLPFLPTGCERQDIVEAVAAGTPYVLDVETRWHRLQAQAGAVVRAAQADVVLGRDGQVRVRVRYRLFNRRQQFLRLRLPKGGVLFGATVAGRPAKPLEGADGDVMIPVPKVPLGGAGYTVAVLYRAPAGTSFPASDLEVTLPELPDVEVDRTLVRLYAPEGYDYDIETDMLETETAEIAADLAEAAVREAKDLIAVAGSGTLEQRQRAAQNAAVLVAEANDLNRRAGNEYAELGREVQQVTWDFDEKYKSIVSDLEAAGREVAGQQIDVFTSNVAPILEGRVPMVPSGSELGGVRPARTGQAQWRFNTAEAAEKGNKQEYQQLKERLGKALEDRDAQEIVDADVEIAQASNIAVLVRSDGSTVQPDATWRNFEALNENLLVEQKKNRQLGVVTQSQETPQIFFVSPANQGGVPFGAFYNDGDGDGDYRARTEQVFEEALAVDSFSYADDIRPAHGQATRGRARSGLMGVDVALPKEGKVFLFRSLRSGAPLSIEVSETGTSSFVRWVIFVFAIAAIAGAVVGVRRWQRRVPRLSASSVADRGHE